MPDNDPAPPRKRDPERTRARILESATEVFAQRGFVGTTLAHLVDACGVNRRMIYHYFGDKRGLYRAIFVAQWQELSAALIASLAPTSTDSGTGVLAIPIAAFFDFLVEHRPFVRLMMWEGLEGGEISRDIWDEVRGPVFHGMAAVIRQAQADERMDPKLDPAHLVISLMGAVTFYFAYAPTLEQVFEADPLSDASLAEHRAHFVRLVMGLLRTPPGR